jgi:hypothetical protein
MRLVGLVILDYFIETLTHTGLNILIGLLHKSQYHFHRKFPKSTGPIAASTNHDQMAHITG